MVVDHELQLLSPPICTIQIYAQGTGNGGGTLKNYTIHLCLLKFIDYGMKFAYSAGKLFVKTSKCFSDDSALDRFAMRRFSDDYVGSLAQPSHRRYLIQLINSFLFFFRYVHYFASTPVQSMCNSLMSTVCQLVRQNLTQLSRSTNVCNPSIQARQC